MVTDTTPTEEDARSSAHCEPGTAWIPKILLGVQTLRQMVAESKASRERGRVQEGTREGSATR